MKTSVLHDLNLTLYRVSEVIGSVRFKDGRGCELYSAEMYFSVLGLLLIKWRRKLTPVCGVRSFALDIFTDVNAIYCLSS